MKMKLFHIHRVFKNWGAVGGSSELPNPPPPPLDRQLVENIVAAQLGHLNSNHLSFLFSNLTFLY